MPFFQIPIWRHQGSRGGTKQTGTPNLLGWTYEPRTIGHLRKDSNPPTAGPRSDPPAPGAPLHCVFPLNKNILIEPQKLSKLKINIDRVLLPTQQIFLKFYWLSHWCLWKQMQKKKNQLLLSDPVWEVHVPFSYPVSSSFSNLKWSSWVFNDTVDEYRPFILQNLLSPSASDASS